VRDVDARRTIAPDDQWMSKFLGDLEVDGQVATITQAVCDRDEMTMERARASDASSADLISWHVRRRTFVSRIRPRTTHEAYDWNSQPN
jgi:hypothetical protein